MRAGRFAGRGASALEFGGRAAYLDPNAATGSIPMAMNPLQFIQQTRWRSGGIRSAFSRISRRRSPSRSALGGRAGLEDEIDEVLVPTEEVIEVRRGKKVTTERRFMPGYVLVHMEMSDQGYHLINSINRVTGFLGPQGRPMPMRDAEVNAILNRVQEGEEAPRTLIHFEIGEKVKVNDGPFEDFDGMVEEVDDDNQRLKVTVSIFGRETPVELEFTQVTKQPERPDVQPWEAEARHRDAGAGPHNIKGQRARPEAVGKGEARWPRNSSAR
jgi:transcriptional antiterminator NusG